MSKNQEYESFYSSEEDPVLRIIKNIKTTQVSGSDPEIFKMGGTLCWPRGWPAKKILGLRWSKKTEVT